jgi:hypothetical protein
MNFKKLSKDKGAFNQLLVIGVVALIAIAGIAYFFLLPSDGGSGDGDMTATVYIEDVETGQVLSSEISLEEASFSESMMLTFGESIRSTTMTYIEDYTIPTAIKTEGLYRVWMEVKITASWSGVQITKNEVTFTGTSGLGGSTLTSANIAEKTFVATNKITNGDSVVNMQTLGKTWTHRLGLTNNAIQLNGASLDNMKLMVTALLSGSAPDGTAYGFSDNAILNIDVNSFDKAQITVSITDISIGGPVEGSSTA